MSYQSNILSMTKLLHDELSLLGVTGSSDVYEPPEADTFDFFITNKVLHKKTEKLFKDGHHARAVEEAFKLLDNEVKKRSGLGKTDLTGAKLMNTVFSANSPILKINSGVTTSEKDEQTGYMQIFAGCMTGIRNPRAHETDWEDTEQRALQLLVLANHLVERVLLAEKVIEK